MFDVYLDSHVQELPMLDYSRWRLDCDLFLIFSVFYFFKKIVLVVGSDLTVIKSNGQYNFKNKIQNTKKIIVIECRIFYRQTCRRESKSVEMRIPLYDLDVYVCIPVSPHVQLGSHFWKRHPNGLIFLF